MWPRRTFLLSLAGIALAAPSAIIAHMWGNYQASTSLWEIVMLAILGGMYSTWIIRQEKGKQDA